MDWSHYSIPAMQLEARFGDRVVPTFCERPKSIWAMVSDAATRNPDGEALVCGITRMTWHEVYNPRKSQRGCEKWACKAAIALRFCSATASNSHSRCSARRISAL